MELKIDHLPLFNQAKALEACHNDKEIMMKLRGLLIQALPGQLEQATCLWRKQQATALQNHLHHILGGAKVCAADRLVETISQLKDELKNANQNQNKIKALWQALETIIQSMQQHEPSAQ